MLLLSGVVTVALTILWSAAGSDTSRKVACYHHDDNHLSVYNFSLPDVHGEKTINISDYKGQVLLLVNVAGFWGSTPQYYGLNALQETYKNFQIIGIPSNIFGKQEPGKNGTEILNNLKYVRPGNGFVPQFPLTQKSDVNGKDEDPLYTYLKAYCPPVDDIFYTERAGLFYKPYHNNDVRWNFEKFLINKEGKPVLRYPVRIIPSLLSKDIEDLLEEEAHDLPSSTGPWLSFKSTIFTWIAAGYLCIRYKILWRIISPWLPKYKCGIKLLIFSMF